LPEKIGARKSEKSLLLKGAFLEKIQKFKIFFFSRFGKTSVVVVVVTDETSGRRGRRLGEEESVVFTVSARSSSSSRVFFLAFQAGRD
jgi:hypothetical protein